MVLGAVPFAVQREGLLNGYVKGRIAAELSGLPLALEMDLGTDRPVRGQRNRVRIAFDPGQAALMRRWREAGAVHATQTNLDSLQKERAEARRRADGTAARLAALLAGQARQAAADSAALLQGLIPDAHPAHGQAALGRPVGSANDSAAAALGSTLVAWRQRHDSLSGLLERQQQALAEADAALAAAEQAHQLSLSRSRYGMDRAPLAQRVGQGLRRLELGSCTPEGSDFLVNGVNLQGASGAFASKEFYLALDHGRILDDAQLVAAPLPNRLRQLHESLFFADARDLNPRRIAAIRLGYGLPESTHAHFGFLRGIRFDHPPGASSANGEREPLLNHVAEVNLGLAAGNGQQLRLAYARSVVGPRGSQVEGQAAPAAVSDLFNRSGAAGEALKLAWDASIRATSTRFGAEGRYVAPWFQSYGLGFVRTGTKAGELRLDQQLSERLRMRTRAAAEERTVVGESHVRRMLIRRGQLALQAKASRAVALQLSYAPVLVEWRDAAGPRSLNQAFNGSIALRERWGSTVVAAQAAFSRLSWAASDGGAGSAVTSALGALLTVGVRWSAGMSWTAMVPSPESAAQAASSIGAQAAWRGAKGWSLEASGQFAHGDGPAWLAELRKELMKGMALGARSQRFSNYPLVQGGEALGPVDTDHALTLFLRCQW